MPKSEVMTIIGQFDRLEEVDLSKTDVYLLAAVLKGKKFHLYRIFKLKLKNLACNPVNILVFVQSLPGSILDCVHDRLEECVLELDSFVTRGNKLFESPLFPRPNFHLCAWLFTHLSHVIENTESNNITEEILSVIWCPILGISKESF